ncbi:hypothetical protein DFJ64_1529 [Thermasporomyces composti]|uniref:Uncharacterized protein n=1 Tax=Thermasporomyces composti TaxID=696763 RepID=A0A3D9V3S0_THECX|nr:hypothetical protein DFJ64_1529 [Thermasporomyces composti]
MVSGCAPSRSLSMTMRVRPFPPSVYLACRFLIVRAADAAAGPSPTAEANPRRSESNKP